VDDDHSQGNDDHQGMLRSAAAGPVYLRNEYSRTSYHHLWRTPVVAGTVGGRLASSPSLSKDRLSRSGRRAH